MYCGESTPAVVGIRHVGTSFSRRAVSLRLPRTEAVNYCNKLSPETREDKILIDEGVVDKSITLQGEIMLTELGLYLRYGVLQVHQRELWKLESNYQQAGFVQNLFGLQASLILKRYMDTSSWEKLNEILAEYEDAIVEFTCFDRKVGQLKWNTVFWEVRTDY